MPPKKAKKKGKMKPLLLSCNVSSSQPSPSLSLPLLTSKVLTVVDTDTLLQNLTTVDTIQQPLPKKSKLLMSHTAINHAPSLPTFSEQTEVNVAVDGTSIAVPSSFLPGTTNSTPGKTKQKNTHTARNVPSTPISLLSSVISPVSTPINITKRLKKQQIKSHQWYHYLHRYLVVYFLMIQQRYIH
jgi:hypothetical protein